MLPVGCAGWKAVRSGESGAVVYREKSGRWYAKLGPVAELAAERDRITWLADTGIPGAKVEGWRETMDGACLLTSAVKGVPASELAPDELLKAWPAIADVVRSLHQRTDCPFERPLGTVLEQARSTVAARLVQAEFLPEELLATPPAEILATLEARRPSAETPVVCHGDLCLPNIMVDPRKAQVTGLIDVGRLGLADRYADLALLLANSRETWTDSDHDAEFAARYGIELDATKLQFYLWLDPLTWPGSVVG
nr:aminoglycoside 3'-phosphotransferase [Kineosporia babensis]